LYNRKLSKIMKFKESELAHKYLDGLTGIEIGGSAHNPFGLNTINVDISNEEIFKQEQLNICGEIMKVDIVAAGDDLPFNDKTFDFVISSHVIEHFYDPIKALKEWQRVSIKYIFMIIPHKQRIFDKNRPLTKLSELIHRHENPKKTYEDKHWNVWIPESFEELLNHLNLKIELIQDKDDKVGNGFMVVIKL